MRCKKKSKNNVATRKTPMRSAKKNIQQISTFKASKESEKCKLWLQEQKYFKGSWETLPEKDDDLNSTKSDESIIVDLKQNMNIARYKKHTEFLCEWKKCNAEFTEPNDYDLHVVNHHLNIVSNEGLYECLWDLCDFVTSETTALTRHLSFHAYHSRLKTYGYSVRQNVDVPQCAYDSRNRNYFEDATTDYYCYWKNCNQSFNLIFDFFNHVNKKHSHTRFTKAEFKCFWYECNKTFEAKSTFQFHIKTHTKECTIACPHCGVSFKHNYTFMDHLRRQIVNSLREFQCNQCYKYFSTERILRDHMRRHVNCFKCTLCDMSCPHATALALHIRYKHVTEKPFSCTICSHRTVTKKDLMKHMETHYDKNYDCHVYDCDYTCKSNYLLKKHIAIEHGHGLNIHECHCCKKQYGASSSLSYHLKNKHNFQYPSGHSRFTYKICEDGIYRLQTMRVESLEVTKQIISTNANSNSSVKLQIEDKIKSKKINKIKKTKNLKKSQKRKKKNTTDNEMNETTPSAPVETNCFNITKDHGDQTSVNSNYSLIECKPEFLELQQSDSCSIKNIDNFEIMKYLKVKERVEIKIDDVDNDGNILKTHEIKTEILEI